jgi:hypothetical protein
VKKWNEIAEAAISEARECGGFSGLYEAQEDVLWAAYRQLGEQIKELERRERDILSFLVNNCEITWGNKQIETIDELLTGASLASREAAGGAE